MGTLQEELIAKGIVSIGYAEALKQEEKRQLKAEEKARRKLAHKLEIEKKQMERAEKK